MTTYWAELDTNNIVTQVITGVDDLTIEGIPTGDWYSNFIGAPCVQTFMDNPEKTYAGIFYTYDYATQDFTAPQPFPSWTLDVNNDWQPPTPMPNDASMSNPYQWNEAELVWVAI